ADRNEPLVEMVQERAAAGAIIERPAESVLHQTGVMLFRRDLPQLLEAEPELLRLAPLPQSQTLLQELWKAAAGALGEQRVLRAQFHATGETILVMAILGHAHVAGSDAGHGTAAVEQQLRGGKARIDFNAQCFRLARQPTADIAERNHVIA